MIHQTKIMMLIFTNLCYYNDAFILVKGDITIVGNFRTQVTFNSSTSFIKCITKLIKQQ